MMLIAPVGPAHKARIYESSMSGGTKFGKLNIPDLSTELELSIRTAHNNIHDEMGCKSLIFTMMDFLHVCHNGLNAAM